MNLSVIKTHAIQVLHEVPSIIIGSITGAGIGQFFFHALGTLALGLLGAIGGGLGGWMFQNIVRPKLDKIFKIKPRKG